MPGQGLCECVSCSGQAGRSRLSVALVARCLSIFPSRWPLSSRMVLSVDTAGVGASVADGVATARDLRQHATSRCPAASRRPLPPASSAALLAHLDQTAAIKAWLHT